MCGVVIIIFLILYAIFFIYSTIKAGKFAALIAAVICWIIYYFTVINFFRIIAILCIFSVIIEAYNYNPLTAWEDEHTQQIVDVHEYDSNGNPSEYTYRDVGILHPFFLIFFLLPILGFAAFIMAGMIDTDAGRDAKLCNKVIGQYVDDGGNVLQIDKDGKAHFSSQNGEIRPLNWEIDNQVIYLSSEGLDPRSSGLNSRLTTSTIFDKPSKIKLEQNGTKFVYKRK